MDDLHTYQIEIQGRVDESDINAVGPLQMTVVQGNAESTLFVVRTDQSGLIGLLRTLHGRGLVLLSVHS
jgi:hypothetical protein